MHFHGSTMLSIVIGLVWSGVAFAQPPAKNAQTDLYQERARNYFGEDVLLDQDGVAHRFYSDLLENHVVLINVVFTGCKDSCPMQTQRLRQVRARLAERFGSQIVFLSLSVDPRHDTPDEMKRFAVKQQSDEPGWRFLTAEEAVMANVLRRLGQWTDEPIDHSTLLIAGNAGRRRWMKLRPDSPIERIAADLMRLTEE